MSRLAADRLPGAIAHELRHPLASAMTGVLTAREMVDADDPRAPVLDGALRDLDRLNVLLDGWLRAARTANVRSETVDLDALVAEVAAHAGAQVVSKAPGAVVAGDAMLLVRVFENLFENARHAGAAAIRVAVQVLREQVTVHVEDDGCGVASQDVERVFTPGWSGRGGAGSDLFAVAAACEAHGGRMRCVPLARGTRFSVTLPLAACPALA